MNMYINIKQYVHSVATSIRIYSMVVCITAYVSTSRHSTAQFLTATSEY